MSFVKISGYYTSQCRLNSQWYDSNCIGYNLLLHLMCITIITKDKGLYYDCKNVRRFKIDNCSNTIHSMQPPTTSPLQ